MSRRRTKFEYDEDDYYDYYDDYEDDYQYDENATASKPKQEVKTKSKTKQMSKDTDNYASPKKDKATTQKFQQNKDSLASVKCELKKMKDSKTTFVSNQTDEKPSSSQTLMPKENHIPDAITAVRKRKKIEDILRRVKDLKPRVGLVVAGHVDAGKSTLMGHLLFLLGHVDKRVIQKYEKESKLLGKASFAFAWVLDEHDEERERGVTVDVGVKHFETQDRKITLLDAPGHRDFIPNMISGASQADAALLVVPASKGEFEASFQHNGQTQEHALLLRHLGVSRIIVVINKMDSCSWSETRYAEIQNILNPFLMDKAGFTVDNIQYIPVSGLNGENLKICSEPMLKAWYTGPTLVESINSLPITHHPLEKALRMNISDVHGMTVTGKVEAGFIQTKDKLILCPEGEKCTVRSILKDGTQVVTEAIAGDYADVVLASIEPEHLHIGSILCPPNDRIPISDQIQANIITLEALEVPILRGSQYSFHSQSLEIPVTVTNLLSSRNPEVENQMARVVRNPRFVVKHQSACILLQLERAICVEKYEDYQHLGQFVLRSNGLTVAAGVITKVL